MNLLDICALADTYYIAEYKAEINQKYYSSSDLIFSDGTFKHHINVDGYIEIHDINNADYLVFIDQLGNLFLSIYKYTIEPKYKDILDHIDNIRAQTGMYRHTKSHDNIEKLVDIVESDIPSILTDDELVNINNLICSVCNSTEFVEPFEYTKDYSIKCQCAKCHTIYELIPSKYYLVKSSTVFNALQKNAINRQLSQPKEDKK